MSQEYVSNRRGHRSGGWFSNLRIGAKITAGYMLVIVLLAIVAALSYWGLQSVQRADADALERQADIADLWAMELYMTMQYAHQADLIINEDASMVDEFRDAVAEMDKHKDAVTITVDTAEEERLLADIERIDQQFDALFFNQIVPAQEAGDMELLRTLDDQSDALLDRMRDAVNQMIASYDGEVKEAESESQRVQRQVQVLMLGGPVVATIVGLGFGFFLSRSISRPVQDVAQVATLLADGDLRQTVEVTTGDEVGEMAEAFRQMLANLRDLVGQVQRGSQEVLLAGDEIAVTSEQSASATNQVAATMQQIAQGTAQQTETVNRTTMMVEQVSRAIEGVARGAQEQSIAVTQSAEVTNQMSAAVEQVVANAQSGATGASEAAKIADSSAETIATTIEGMQAIKRAQDQALLRVQEMGARSEEIGMIVATIEDIASQTNLLALNANIEAARAGEYGKGFAVVADAVGRLAMDAKAATQEIAALVKEIQQTVTLAVDAMQQGADEVDAGVVRAQDSGRALSDILQAINTVNKQMDEIAVAADQMEQSTTTMVGSMDAVSAVVEENTASTEEMASSAESVLGAVEEIASISEENSASTEEISASIEEVSAQAEEVTASAQALRGMAQELQSLVARFKLPEG